LGPKVTEKQHYDVAVFSIHAGSPVQIVQIHNQYALHDHTVLSRVKKTVFNPHFWEHADNKGRVSLNLSTMPFLYFPHICDSVLDHECNDGGALMDSDDERCEELTGDTQDDELNDWLNSAIMKEKLEKNKLKKSANRLEREKPLKKIPAGILTKKTFKKQVELLISFKSEQKKQFDRRLAQSTVNTHDGISVAGVMSSIDVINNIEQSQYQSCQDNQHNPNFQLPSHSKTHSTSHQFTNPKLQDGLIPPVICPHLLPIDLNFQQSHLCLCRKMDCPYCFGWLSSPFSTNYHSDLIKMIKNTHENSVINAFRQRAIPRTMLVTSHPNCLACHNISFPKFRYPIYNPYFTHIIYSCYSNELTAMYQELGRIIKVWDNQDGFENDHIVKDFGKTPPQFRRNKHTMAQQMKIDSQNMLKFLSTPEVKKYPMLQFIFGSRATNAFPSQFDTNIDNFPSDCLYYDENNNSIFGKQEEHFVNFRNFVEKTSNRINQILKKANLFVIRSQRQQYTQTYPLSGLFQTIECEDGHYGPKNQYSHPHNQHSHTRNPYSHSQNCQNNSNDFQNSSLNLFPNSTTTHSDLHLLPSTNLYHLPNPNTHSYLLKPILLTQCRVYQKVLHLKSLLPNINTIFNTTSTNVLQFQPLQDVLLQPLSSKEIVHSLALPVFLLRGDYAGGKQQKNGFDGDNQNNLSVIMQQQNPLFENVLQFYHASYQEQLGVYYGNKSSRDNTFAMSNKDPTTPSSHSSWVGILSNKHHLGDDESAQTMAGDNGIKQLTFPSLSSQLLTLMSTPKARAEILPSRHRLAQMHQYLREENNGIVNRDLINNYDPHHSQFQQNGQAFPAYPCAVLHAPLTTPNLINKSNTQHTFFRQLHLPDHYLFPLLLEYLPYNLPHPCRLHYQEYSSHRTMMIKQICQSIAEFNPNDRVDIHIIPFIQTTQPNGTSITSNSPMETIRKVKREAKDQSLKITEQANLFSTHVDSLFQFTFHETRVNFIPPTSSILYPSANGHLSGNNTSQPPQLKHNQLYPTILQSISPKLCEAIELLTYPSKGVYYDPKISLGGMKTFLGSILDHQMVIHQFKSELDEFNLNKLHQAANIRISSFEENEKCKQMGAPIRTIVLDKVEKYLGNPLLAGFFFHFVPFRRQYNPELILSPCYSSLYLNGMRNLPQVNTIIETKFPLNSIKIFFTYLFIQCIQEQFDLINSQAQNSTLKNIESTKTQTSKILPPFRSPISPPTKTIEKSSTSPSNSVLIASARPPQNFHQPPPKQRREITVTHTIQAQVPTIQSIPSSTNTTTPSRSKKSQTTNDHRNSNPNQVKIKMVNIPGSNQNFYTTAGGIVTSAREIHQQNMMDKLKKDGTFDENPRGEIRNRSITKPAVSHPPRQIQLAPPPSRGIEPKALNAAVQTQPQIVSGPNSFDVKDVGQRKTKNMNQIRKEQAAAISSSSRIVGASHRDNLSSSKSPAVQRASSTQQIVQSTAKVVREISVNNTKSTESKKK
jgi:hypothetical protein